MCFGKKKEVVRPEEVHPVLGGLIDGRIIRVVAIVAAENKKKKKTEERILLRLQRGPSVTIEPPKDHVSLNMEFDFEREDIILNTFTSAGGWGESEKLPEKIVEEVPSVEEPPEIQPPPPEEKKKEKKKKGKGNPPEVSKPPSKMPVAKGMPTDLRIVCHEEEYEIWIDGKELGKYQHRIPYQQVTHVAFFGFHKLQSLSLETQPCRTASGIDLPVDFQLIRQIKNELNAGRTTGLNELVQLVLSIGKPDATDETDLCIV